MKQRLQKIISAAGLASRRAAEEMIASGRVKVNGITAKLGDSADTDTDEITLDGKKLRLITEHTYIMLNKPRGYVTTMSDEKGRKCVSDLVSELPVRVYPVGRLDMYSEGLLIMTDDGELANKLMHPSCEINKTYHAWISGGCSDRQLAVLSSALDIDGYIIKPAELAVLSRTADGALLSITIHEGRNRQIRKMCDIAGVKLTRLKRVSEGAVALGDLPVGKWRYLTAEELQAIRSV